MAQNTTVTLSSNGKYWQAYYYDNNGRRHAKNLGPKAKLSRRQAKVQCDRLAAVITVSPGRRDIRGAPSLQGFIEHYIASRIDLAESSVYLLKHTGDLLSNYFDGSRRIDQITRSAARDWRTC